MERMRWVTLDVIKALCLVAMIFVHNTIWWLSYHPFAQSAALEGWFNIPRIAAFFVMMFPATAGAALFFYFRQHEQAMLPPFKYILKRALILISVGFSMNLLAFGSESLFQWNVLQFFSLSMLVVYVCLRFLHLRWLLVMGSLSLVLAPVFRMLFEQHSDIYLIAILFGEPHSIHFWPFFPWFSMVAIGYILAHTLYRSVDATRSLQVISVGVLFVLWSAIADQFLYAFDFHNLWGGLIFQPPTLQVVGSLGVCLITFGSVHLIAQKKMRLYSYGLINTLSIGLFYIYVTHMIIGHHMQIQLLQYQNIMLLWYAIIFQLILAYVIGCGVIYKRRHS